MGYPGRHTVIARRAGDSWYLAGINGRDEKLELTLDLRKILGSGGGQMTVIADGRDGRTFASGEPPPRR